MDLLRICPSCILLLTLVLFIQPPECFANTESPLSREELLAELEDIEKLIDLMPFEKQNPEVLKQRLLADDYRMVENKHSLFGLDQIKFEKSGKHKTIYLSFAFFNSEQLAEYLVHIYPHKNDDLGLKTRAVWLRRVGESTTKNNNEIQVYVKFADVFDEYYQTVANGHGELLSVNVPEYLMTAYEYLVSDLQDSSVGSFCYKIPWLAQAKCAVDQLVAADRVDLLENVLNGFNPGARIAAAIELTRLGSASRPDIQKTIRNLVRLNTPIKVDIEDNLTITIKAPNDIQALIEQKNVPEQFFCHIREP